ncbi:bifunctional adenosylcobinamide kinase/adenosylcobinamide-phosphate guanylyltransferase [Rhizorhabdus sp. FW153]|uniref:bifunctional adenosylcobinamide kinase/adenosylcobinamide-phosphate guanylyltransferase n=1 Tax=Rhizorhabdus sp. FW153 TaxID=3400216 RepID=UPI003CEA7632
MNAQHLLVIGGARSGKSRYAQQRAEATGLRRMFVATAQAFDAEMRDRIDRHRDDRGPDWETVECPLALAEAVTAHAAPDALLLVDCLTLWTSNLILSDADCFAATTLLVEALGQADGPVILVTNEVGLGIVPDNALARRFRDEAGIVNQRIAAAVPEVQLLTAGIALCLKG